MLAVINEIQRKKGLMLTAAPVTEATQILEPSSTKNESSTPDSKMRPTWKGGNEYFDMKMYGRPEVV